MKFKNLIVAVPLILGTAGLVTISTSIATAPSAEAFGLGDITGAVKDAAKKVGKAAGSNAKDFGSAFKRDMNKAGGKIKKVGKAAGSNAKDFGSALKRDIGKIYPGPYKFTPPTIPPQKEPDNVHKPGLKSANKIKMISRDRSSFGRPVGQMRMKSTIVKDRSTMGRPIGIKIQNLKANKKKPISRDRSSFGRPVGMNGKNFRHNKMRKAVNMNRNKRKHHSMRKVQGITKQNLKFNKSSNRNKSIMRMSGKNLSQNNKRQRGKRTFRR